ncbi:MAG TPA: Asp-tRNA(Asn)/Glu-tRNA(Gln) amidotransferase subunit GatA [Candidatus Saccharimonadales bacterium]|nr:Asp-tRNA(Asn)/Glu-tRNA(Gln) amidotransferase subunit GatA [Candidatus Saccharimonadales bacterium]
MIPGAAELARRLRAGRIRPTQVAEEALRQVAAWDGRLHAFLSLRPAEELLAEAARLERQPRDSWGPLAGVPVALKDNLCLSGLPCTCGSKILEHYRPPFDATVVARLRQAGALVLGKTNLDEFAMGSSTENSAFGPTRNPWDLDRVPGGSSGGSAAAVAAGVVPLALGSDTGGSVRQPAALCGVTGMKPTYGRVSRYGLVAYASSLDQVSPFGRSVEDVALLLQVIAGPDPLDSTCMATSWAMDPAELGAGVAGLRVGVPENLLREGLDPEMQAAFHAAVDALGRLGAARRTVELMDPGYALSAYYIVAPAEASSNLARYDAVRYGLRLAPQDLRGMYQATRRAGFGAEVRRRIMIGTYALSAGYYDAYYLKALKVRTLIRRDFERAFGEVDVVAIPTSPTPAFGLGERVADPLAMYLSDVFTLSVNLAGLPGISVPCGFTASGLPLGLQLIGRWGEDGQVLRVAQAYQQATEFHLREPRPAGGAA